MQFTWTELEPFVVGGLGILCTVMGWVLRSLYDGLNKLREDLVKLQTSLPDMYARRDDMKTMEERVIAEFRLGINQINSRLGSIESRMSAGAHGHGG